MAASAAALPGAERCPRAELRRTKSTGVLTEMKAWLGTTTPIGDGLRQPIRYTVNAWPALRAVVEEPKIWLDNNQPSVVYAACRWAS